MRYLITGGCGFLGSNIAREILRIGDELVVFDNLSRTGSAENLRWLQSFADFVFVHGDIRNALDCSQVVQRYQPDVVFHLAGQVAMTTSLSSPYHDFEVNTVGTLNMLEAIRTSCPQAAILYSSTNKVYGDLEYLHYTEMDSRYAAVGFENGLPESVNLAFKTPYGCSKGAADQYILDYSKMFGIQGVVFRHSSMYGGRQFATLDQGWIGWFCGQALLQKQGADGDFTISGSGKQVRDILHAEDMVRLYLEAARCIRSTAGNAYNIGGGVGNSLSVLELMQLIEDTIGFKPRSRHIAARESDQKYFVADISKIRSAIGWEPLISKQEGIGKMISWVEEMQRTPS
ncbi:MAG: GDP-mannose 4,6-dehydratase [Burkholderiales bacterium]